MTEDDLKRKPSQKAFNETWNWRKKDLVEHPRNALAALDFLARYPQFTADFSGIDPNLDFSNPQTALRQYVTKNPDAHTLYQMGVREQIDAPTLRQIMEQRNLLDSHLNMLLLAREGKVFEARSLLKKEFKLNPDQPLMLDTDCSSHLFGGIENELSKRMEALQEAMARKDMDAFLESFYRPMVGKENAFEHLSAIDEKMIDYLKSCPQKWQDHTLAMIEKDRALRGIHLALNALKSRDESVAEICDKLLQKQYEKAYQRPFSQIENSDYLWD